jgi:hypothetical protein
VFLDLFTFEIDIWARLRRATESARADLLAADWHQNRDYEPGQRRGHSAFSSWNWNCELQNALVSRQDSLRLIKVQQQGGVATFWTATGRATGLRSRAGHTGRRATNRANRESHQFAAGQKPGSYTTKPWSNGAANASRRAGRLALLAPRKASGHPGGGAASDRANANIGVAKAAYFPRLRLQQGWAFKSSALSNLFSSSSFLPGVLEQIFDV